METRPGCKVHTTIVTSCHGNDDEAWSTSCLIIQHKPYIVEQPQTCPFKSYYHYTKVCKLVYSPLQPCPKHQLDYCPLYGVVGVRVSAVPVLKSMEIIRTF